MYDNYGFFIFFILGQVISEKTWTQSHQSQPEKILGTTWRVPGWFYWAHHGPGPGPRTIDDQ